MNAPVQVDARDVTKQVIAYGLLASLMVRGPYYLPTFSGIRTRLAGISFAAYLRYGSICGTTVKLPWRLDLYNKAPDRSHPTRELHHELQVLCII